MTECVSAHLWTWSVCLTVVWDDGPGHGSSVDTAEHPEHAQPAEMLASLFLGQELRIIGKYDGNGAANTAQRTERKGRVYKDDKRKE